MTVLVADDFPGIDIYAKVNAAIASVNGGPATIVLTQENYPCKTALNAANTNGIHLTSYGGDLNVSSNSGPRVIWQDSAGSGSSIKAPGSRGFEISRLNLTYDDPTYDGNLVSLSDVNGIDNTVGSHIHHARICGMPSAKAAARLIELNHTLTFSIDHAHLDYAQVGIGCSGGSNNHVVIGAGMWFDKNFTNAAVRGNGAVWELNGNFESTPGSVTPLTPLFRLDGEMNGINFNTVIGVDGGTAGGTLIDFSGHPCHGITFGNGTLLGAGGGTAIRCSDVPGETSGLVIGAIKITGMNTGVHLGSAEGISLMGAHLAGNQIPWTGTAPTRYFITGNNLGGTDTSGIPVAGGTSIAVSPLGNSRDGAGLLSVYVFEDNAQAIIALIGSAGAAQIVFDSQGIFSTTHGTAGKMNFYWDSNENSYRCENRRNASRTVVTNSIMGI